MFKMSFSDGLAIAGIAITVILVVLDKADKLKSGPMLLILLAVAAVMTFPLALGNSWVSDAPPGMLKFTRGLLMVFTVGVLYSLIAVWISKGDEHSETKAKKPVEESGESRGQLARGSSSASKIAEPVVKKVIPDWQKVVILQTLSQFPGQKVRILVGIGDEARAKANEFRELFLKAQWKVDGPKPAPLNQMVLDVQLSADNRMPARTEVLAVFSALKSSGVKCRSTWVLDSNVPRDLMVLWVGPETPLGSPEHIPLSLPSAQKH